MNNQALSDAHRALGISNALKVAVVALVATHPDPDSLRKMLSGLFSSMASPDSPLSRSPSAQEGWNEVVHLIQDSLGGFPVMTDSDRP